MSEGETLRFGIFLEVFFIPMHFASGCSRVGRAGEGMKDVFEMELADLFEEPGSQRSWWVLETKC